MKSDGRRRTGRTDWSLPTRERGLKSENAVVFIDEVGVAPHAGAWVEICWLPDGSASFPVAPHAGAWVEISLLQ